MPSPAPRSPRYLSLDFWRGVACLSVIIFHSCFYMRKHGNSSLENALAWGLNHLWFGVPCFFVISGYCLAAAADSAGRKGMKTSEFFLRRFRRIYPPHWIFLAIAVLCVGVLESSRLNSWFSSERLFSDAVHRIDPPWELNTLQWFGNLSLTELWRLHFFEKGNPEFAQKYFMANIWTLCYEEQFYFVMGLILCFFPRRIFSAALVVTIFALAARHAFPKAETLTGGLISKIPSAGFFFDGNWNMFAVGIWVFYCVNYLQENLRWLAYAVPLLGVAYSFRERTLDIHHYNTDFAALTAFLFAMLLIGLHRFDRSLHEHAWLKPVSWCGVMCYSLYLVHWPITKAVSHICFWYGIDTPLETLLVSAPLGVLVSVLCGYAFHISVERYFLNAPTNVPTSSKAI